MTKNIVFRILRKCLAQYERKRPYGFRKQIWNYSFATNPRGENIFLIVAAASDLSNAAWAAASFLSHSDVLAQDARLVFCLHGDTDSHAASLMRETFPDAEISSTSSVVKELKLPRLQQFAAAHPLGGKLAALIYYSRCNPVLYSDSDVLAFAPIVEIDAALACEKSVFMSQLEQGCYDKMTAAIAAKMGYSLPRALNSGLLVCAVGSFDPQAAEELIPDTAEIDPKLGTWWWIEQTIVAALMSDCGSVGLPIERYVASLQRQWPFDKDVDYDAICVRHFISPVRHLMYARGIPIVLKNAASAWSRKKRMKQSFRVVAELA